MTEQKPTIYRERSLGGLSTPERLDQLLRVVRPQSWAVALAVGCGIALAAVWSVIGRIPSTASGTAILVHPKLVVGFQSPASGPIGSLAVEAGQLVKAGDVLAMVRQPVLEAELNEQRGKLLLFDEHDVQLTDLEREQAKRELEAIQSQRDQLVARLEHLRETSEAFRVENENYLERQRETVARTIGLSSDLGEVLEARYERVEALVQSGDSSLDELVDPRRDLVGNQLLQAELSVKQQELDLQATLAKERYEASVDTIHAIQVRLEELSLRELEVSHKLEVDEIAARSDRAEILRRISELEARLKNETEVVSAHSGRVLEVTANVGQQVAIGQRLGKIEIEDPSRDLMVLAYFQIKDGKRLQPDLPMRITPSTVDRERFGGIRGQVVTASTYPVTTEAAANQIGDLETARTLLGGTTRIEVLAALEADPETYTGYAWTSGQGPETTITPGTTAEVRVTVEEIRPITLVFPFLKSLFGA